MRNNKPSLKTLEAAFPTKGKTLRRLLTNEAAVWQHPAVTALVSQCYHTPKLAHARMVALNAELECFGVEYVKGSYTQRSPSFEYCNTGDSYGTTIIRFVDGRYRVGDWGTIVERGNYA